MEFMSTVLGKPFSEPEKEVIPLLFQGLTTSEMASALGVKPGTITTRRNMIYKKLGVKNKEEACNKLLEGHYGEQSSLHISLL